MEAIFLVANVDKFVISEDINVDTVGYLVDMVDSEVVIVDTVWDIVDKVALGPDRVICIEDTVDWMVDMVTVFGKGYGGTVTFLSGGKGLGGSINGKVEILWKFLIILH